MKVKKGLLKNALSKGEKAAASSSKGPLSKGQNANLSEGKLTKKNLKNLGTLSLEEKVEKIAEQTDTAEEAA